MPSATDDTDWVDVWDGVCHAGGRRIEAPTPLERLPVYARAGSVLPLARPDSGPEDLDILVFPGADGSFELYEDEGDGWGYEQGASTLTALRWNEATGTLTVGRPAGDYPGRPARRAVRARLVEPGRGWADSSAPWVTAEQQGQELPRHHRLRLRPHRPGRPAPGVRAGIPRARHTPPAHRRRDRPSHWILDGAAGKEPRRRVGCVGRFAAFLAPRPGREVHRVLSTRSSRPTACEDGAKQGKTRREIIRCLKRYAAPEVFHLVRAMQS
ncbi:DUF5110 domain-containing protein [Streptomyces sp. NBC_01589]|uniref:DUF5110 domain-containing protein n=1 Tax=Streptomyces sp. NBC_01589 TaxID=2975886 RepID=UPI003868F993